jgi:trans-aconitate methyltransferase
MSGWDADRYQRQFGFVSAMAGGVLELLAASPGEVVLDLGCGTGELAARIAATGARVIGLDSDPAMVAAAARRLGAESTMLAEGHDFRLPAPVDAVFSNAALHWMPRPGEVVGRVRAALLPQVQARVNELAAPRLRRGGEGSPTTGGCGSWPSPTLPRPGRVEYPPGRRRGWSEPLR